MNKLFLHHREFRASRMLLDHLPGSAVEDFLAFGYLARSSGASAFLLLIISSIKNTHSVRKPVCKKVLKRR